MSHLQLAFRQQALRLLAQLQQAQQVGDRRTRTPHSLSDGFMGHAKLVQQTRQSPGLLQGIEVFPLHVLDQRDAHRGLVVQFPHHCRDLVQTRQLGRAPAALAGDDLELVPGAQGPGHDRLQHALSFDGVRQLLQGGRGEVRPRLPGSPLQKVHRQDAQGTRARLLHDLGGGNRPQQGVKPFAQAFFSCRHDAGQAALFRRFNISPAKVR